MILYGVGVGPGDPELVTMQAVRVLREADTVLVPVMSETELGRAEAVVRAHLGDALHIRRLVFALNEREDQTRRHDAWDAAAEQVLTAFDDGAQTVAFATIGDPNMYSTFTYLAETVLERRDVEIRTIPGITAMQDLAARSGTVLCEGTEPLVLVPFTAEGDVVERALGLDATVVTYKAGRRIDELKATLKQHDRLDSAVFGALLGLPDEQIRDAAGVDRAPYLSTVIAPARRNTRGGKL